jgi:hypothetical protein
MFVVLAEVQWDQFWVMMVPGLLTILFSIGAWIRADAAARSAKSAADAGDKNSGHLTRQDEKLNTIEYQVSEDCIVKKAAAEAKKLMETAITEATKLREQAAAEARKVLVTAERNAALVHEDVRKVAGVAAAAATELKTAATELKKQADDSKVLRADDVISKA